MDWVFAFEAELSVVTHCFGSDVKVGEDGDGCFAATGITTVGFHCSHVQNNIYKRGIFEIFNDVHALLSF